MVFLCHDVNDIFMEGAKMARYAEHNWLPTALFGVFMASWFTSRIYYFPAHVIRSVYYEPIEVQLRLLAPLDPPGAPQIFCLSKSAPCPEPACQSGRSKSPVVQPGLSMPARHFLMRTSVDSGRSCRQHCDSR